MRWRAAAASSLICACFGGPPGVGADEGTDASTGASTSTAGESMGSGESAGTCDCPEGNTCVNDTCVPAGCGDGIVSDDEECDDGPDNAQDASCKLDCTVQFCGDGEVGPAESCDDANDMAGDGCHDCVVESCGNGTRDPGETCDDANAVDGDGCNVDCQESGVVVWEHFHDGAIGANDRAQDIDVFGEGGRIVVVGAVVDDGANPEAWVRVLDPDGAIEYSSPVQDEHDDPVEMYGVACGGAICFAVATRESTGGDMNARAFLQLVEPDGAMGPAFELEKGDAEGRGALGVDLTMMGPDVAGFTQVAGDTDGLLDKRDGMLDTEGQIPLVTGPGDGTLRRVVRDGLVRYVVGWQNTTDNTATEGSLLRIGALAEVNLTIPIGGRPFTQATCLAVDSDGSIVVGGNASDLISTAGPGSAVFRRYADNGGLVWNADSDFGGESARIDDVEIAGNGDIVAVGALRTDVETGYFDALVVRYSPTGEENWRRVFEGDGNDLAAGVAIQRETGGILVAGRRSVDGSEDAWVARLTP